MILKMARIGINETNFGMLYYDRKMRSLENKINKKDRFGWGCNNITEHADTLADAENEFKTILEKQAMGNELMRANQKMSLRSRIQPISYLVDECLKSK